MCRGFFICRENEPKYAVDALTSGFTKCRERTGCAALHVRCAASVHAVTLDAGAPRIFHAGGRDDVDVSREHEFGHARFAAAGSGEQHWVGRFREEDADVGLDAVDSIRSRAVSSTCRQAGDPETLGTRTSACVQRTARCSNVSCGMKMSFKEWLCVPWRIARSPELSGQDNRSSPASKIK